ncbi:sulfotransferase [Parvibaculaceae bacterium PLY_AMNH_Bact1]|nr:sulfotransferase [Parvibaculaceae bacterium PLY_AMNH_Bact1]
MSAGRTHAIIFGAPRSGTTSLWRYLAQHPDIAESRVKELDYFRSGKRTSDYESNFAAGGLSTLEASPSYFREHSDVVPRLHADLPTARLICILREPAARLSAYFRGERDWEGRIAPDVTFSDYTKIVATDADPTPINPINLEVADYVKAGSKVGNYTDILQHYFCYFSAEQILVLFLDEMIENPEDTLARCAAHIGVDAGRFPPIAFKSENQGVSIKNIQLFRVARAINNYLEPTFNKVPAVKEALRWLHHRINAQTLDRQSVDELTGKEILQNWYAPANRRLAELLKDTYPGQQLPIWLAEDDDHLTGHKK